MEVISHDKDTLFLTKEGLLIIEPGIPKYVCQIPTSTLRQVQQIITPMICGLNKLRIVVDGKAPYWEDGWHDKLTSLIVDLTELDKTDVSNSISALLECGRK